MEFLRKQDESIKKYKIRLFQNKDIYDLNSQDIADLVNKETGDNFSESVYRKWFKIYNEAFEDAQKENLSGDKIIQEYELKRIEFEKEKIKFSDQRTAYNKIVREQARSDELNNMIQQAINSNNLSEFNYTHTYIQASDNDLLIGLNDLHYGLVVDNYWNKYSSEVCKERLMQYLDKIISIQQLHQSENCYVCANGDLISGNTHIQIAVANRENVIEQIMGVSELISWFLVELSKHFNQVNLVVVAGNHSRLGRKDDSLKDERLDDLIPWYIKARLQNIDNINLVENNIDNTMSMVDIRRKNYLSIHGDYDSGKNMAGILSSMLNDKIYAVITGHLHHNSVDTQQGIKVIMSGSMLGVDDYCIQKRIFCSPEQVVCVCNEDGIDAIYDVQLN